MVGGGLEKSGDGQEGEEAPDTLPPFELRRPGSVGLALTGRTAVVPHSLHSPHDRTTGNFISLTLISLACITRSFTSNN